MTLYSVFERPDEIVPVVVPEKFSWFAALLQPAFILALFQIGFLARITRSAMLDVLDLKRELDAGEDVLLLGPVAVHPTRQGEGLGGLLINESLAEARRLGWERVLLVGDAPYYGRFGFAILTGVVMPPPTNPDRVLGLALKTGAWAGVVGPVTKATGV